MKKLIAILLAALMVCTLCVTVFADTDFSDHTYTAYQIFSGTQNEGEAELADIAWGSGINGDMLIADLKNSEEFGASNPFVGCETAFGVAGVLENYKDNSDVAKIFAKIAYNHITDEGIAVENGQTEIPAGYYLIVDTTEDADVYNLVLLQQTQKGTFEIAVKVDVPEVIKKVSDASGLICTNTSEAHVHNKDCYKWEDSNKVAIGDTVLFDVKGTVPAAAADYDYYYYILNDTLSEGLTYADGFLMVTIGGELAAEGSDYSVRLSEDGRLLQIALIDAKGNAGKTVEANYAAILNDNAVIGSAGNPNTVTVTYSNNPSFKYDGTQLPGGFPDPDEEERIPTGETPKDITLTYTTALKLYKVDQDKNPLEGAEFTLTGEGLNIVLIARDAFAVSANGAYWKLANGSFTKTPPTTEDSMDPAEPGATKTYVKAENGYTGEAVIVGGITYRPYKASTDAGKQQYSLTRNNVAQYDSITTKYAKTVVVENKVITNGVNVSAFVDDKGIVILEGLNAGEYTLSETKVPDGFNKIDDITFTITCDLPDEVVTGKETCKWEVSSDSDITYSEENNAFELTVVNQKGSLLPETGGIGTTIFYILGGLLAAGAVILLIVKKRMNTED